MITGAERLDGIEGRPTATSLLLGMATHFDAHYAEEVHGLPELLRTHHGLAPSEEYVWVFPTAEADGG